MSHLKVINAHEEQAKILDAQFDKATRGMIEIVVLGAALIATRDELKRRAVTEGHIDRAGLKGWLAEHLPHRSYSTAHRAMQLAENAAKMAKLSGNVDIGWLLTASAGEMSADLEAKRTKLEKLLAANSQNQMLLFGGAKSDAKPRPVVGGGAAREVHLEKETAEAFWSDLLVAMEVEGFKEASWMHLDKSTRKALAECLRDLAAKISKSI